ncbi:MAG: tetratricopeptide repeat protein [Bacteroidales bacterium]|nr:tetratricopeptide repeat protein [Bacteroidales bacterium]
MRKIQHIIIFIMLGAGSLPLMAQELIKPQPIVHPQDNKREKQRLGIQYYQNRDFEKSLEIFNELYAAEPVHINYTYALYSLVELRNFEEAEKLAKKHIKSHPVQLQYQVDLGFIYIRSSQPEKAQKAFDEVIERLKPNVNEIKQVANAFYLRNQTEYAIKTYEQGKILMKGEYNFDIELATMYERNGNYEQMAETYLDHLEDFPDARESVQNRLQSAMNRDIENILPGILREALLIRYQENPEEVTLNELLLWLSVQQKDFAFAFIQARSLDRRFNEEGHRILDLGELAMSNKDYDAALDCYEYILGKGKAAPLYLNGLIGFLETRYQQISDNIKIEKQELLALEEAYIEAIEEFGIHRQTIQLLRDLAHIQAFHLEKEVEAIKNLDQAIAVPGPETIDRAECKLELADIYLFRGEVWEATLLYSQVEKTFKNEPIGHMAKLKNARLTYYIGEFNWAKAQLDVLKAATSKLIANDALELSLLIADNIEADSSYNGLRLYAKADLLAYQNRLDDALSTLDSINMLGGWHPLFDEVLYQKAGIRMKQGMYEKADSLLEQITYAYPDDILGDDALFSRARLQEEIFKDTEQAMTLYRELLTRYPGSVFTVEARRKFRALRGDDV